MAEARTLILTSLPVGEVLRTQLEDEGFVIVAVDQLSDFISQATRGSFELLLVDSTVCGDSPLQVAIGLSDIPEIRRTPIIFFGSASASDRIEFVGSGLASEEVRLRMHAAIRRHSKSNGRQVLAFGDLELNTEQYLARRGDLCVRLTRRQLDLLRLLMEHPSTVFPREDLIKAVWGNFNIEKETVTAMIARLRRLLNRGGRPNLIKTVPHVGYILELDGEGAARERRTIMNL